jgi:serine/threonine protein kinase
MERAMGEDSGEEEIKALVKGIQENKPSLLEVDLRHKQLAPHQLIDICDSLKQNTIVTTLSLTGNTLDAAVMGRLAVMLLENRTINELELDFCEINDDLLRILSPALELRRSRLAKLTLMGNATTVKGESDARQYTIEGSSKKSAQAPIDSPTALKHNPGARFLIEELVKQNAAMLEQLRVLQGVAEKKSVDEKKKMMDQVKKHHKVKVNLGNVQINELTAAGNAMGTSLFSCLVDGWQCCMKEMSLEGVSEQEAKSFDTEIELLEKLPYHPNIARYLFHVKSDDRIRLFMTKYAVSLREVISTRRAHVSAGTMSYFYPGEVAKWMAQIASGVEFLHKNHVIHRNLKPDVILCTLDTRGYLSNLAITEFDSAKAISKKKQAKTQIGTPSYMSPEVFSSDGSVAYTHKVDVWGIGMILYELITLMVPYEDEDFVKLNSLIPAGKLPSTDHIASDYDSLLAIFRECTQLDPSKRPEIKRIKEQFMHLSVEFDSFEVQPASSS